MNEEMLLLGRMLTECVHLSHERYLLIRYSRRSGVKHSINWHISYKHTAYGKPGTSSGITLLHALEHTLKRLREQHK